MFKNEELIEQQTNNHKTLITLTQWDLYQGKNEEQNEELMRNQRGTEKETENEKEKRSKREKVKEKEKNKNEKMEEVCVYTREKPLLLGRYKNVLVDKGWLDSFKGKYWYADKVIDKLSVYKQAKGISNIDDRPYLEHFAIEDKDKYIRRDSTFDADEFFELALARSYADDEW